jgi:hypothetical protein
MIRLYMVLIVSVALVADAGAYKCVFCLPGKYKSVIANNACLACQKNTYVDYSGADDQKDCLACPANSETLDTSSSKITDCQCSVGFFGPPGVACQQCAEGRYASNIGQNECSKCPENSNSPLQSDELTDCACVPGYTGQNGGQCTICPQDTYKTTTSSAPCSKCPQNMVSPPGSTALAACVCDTGYTLIGGSCVACLPGQYKTAIGPQACDICPVGRYSGATAKKDNVCSDCPANTYTDANGQDNVLDCRANAGYSGANGVTGVACPAGTFKTETGDLPCTNCPEDTYSTEVAKTTSGCSLCRNTDVNLITDGTLGNDELKDCRCAAGYTGENGDFCFECSAGKYKIIAGSTPCSLCPVDMYSFETKAKSGSTCKTCPANTNAPSGSGNSAFCTCNAGYTGGGDTTACNACVAGTFKVDTGPAECDLCPENKYSLVTSATSSSACETCPENSIAPSGSNELTDCVCKPGFFGKDGEQCTACPAGTYKTRAGDWPCEPCPLHTFSVATAKTDSACTTCLSISGNLPSITLQVGSSVQTQCLCDYGYTGADGGTCRACGVGKYKDSQGSATCSICAVDTYQPFTAKTASTDCSTCPASSVSPAGSSSLTSCECKPGYFGENGGTCRECYAGRYKTQKGPHDCTLCESGKFSSAIGASSAGTCEKCHDFTVAEAGSSVRSDCHCKSGYFTENIGLETAKCVQCKQGSYNSDLNAVACSKCSAGKYTADIGATSGEVCLTCESGYSEEGFAQCEPCPLNSTTFPGFRDHLNDCKCDPGYTGKDGQTCVHCLPGKFKEDYGSAVCSDCPVDTYSTQFAAEFQSDCQDCAAKTEAPRGSDSRDDCKCHVGYTSTVAGTDGEVCEECSAGKFKAVLGHAECSKCPQDTYVDKTGSSSVNACMQCFENSMSPEGSVALENCLCIGGFERAAS